jgi:hypothetical protein
MPYPPIPVVPSVLLAVVAKLGWRPVTRDSGGVELGELFSSDMAHHHLIVVHGGIDGTWTLADAAPRGFDVYLMTRATYDILRTGDLRENGALLCHGVAYHLQALSLDGHHRADAVAAYAAV